MSTKSEYSRRDFLKIVGATTGMAAAGCGKELPEKLIPYVVQPEEVIPGDAAFYSGSCTECGAGCGWMVKTSQGRATKVEGNPSHPVNQGSLCARGQSSLQALYDPDRVREPLKREVNSPFVPASWSEAVAAVADAASLAGSQKKDVVLITAPLSGSSAALVKTISGKLPALKHIELPFLNSDLQDNAVTANFGPGVQVQYDFAAADVVVSVGADYLETWLSPVEFSRGWAYRRRPENGLSHVVQIEPRLSLTGANADRWIKNNPGTELQILLAIAQSVADKLGAKVSAEDKKALRGVVGGYEQKDLLKNSAVRTGMIENIAEKLVSAETSLVVAGGTPISGSSQYSCQVVANLINHLLGNVGKSVKLIGKPASPSSAAAAAAGESGYIQIAALVERLKAKEHNVAAVIIYGINPVYQLPTALGFKTALSKVPTVVSITPFLDETAGYATVVIPVSVGLESWGDSEPYPGVYNLNQPAMQPLYKTQSFGDTLIAIAHKLGSGIDGVANFYDFIRAEWKKRTGETGFEDRWVEYVRDGGDWSKPGAPVRRDFNTSSVAAVVVQPAVKEDLVLLAFPTVNSLDGSSANRSWMQELPDPLSKVVWGSWLEMHPATASRLGFIHGDVAHVSSGDVRVEAPIYVTKNIAENLVAVPIGQGHDQYGRYAKGIGANVLAILPAEPKEGAMQFLRSGITIHRAVSNEKLVSEVGSDSQHGRALARGVTKSELAKISPAIAAAAFSGSSNGGHSAADHSPAGHSAAGGNHGSGHSENGHHENGGANGEHDGHGPLYGPTPERPQMYKQMVHPLYRWAMTVDLAACTGCSACVVACYAENNIPTVGKDVVSQGRGMSWLRIDRYLDPENPDHRPVSAFQPMMCQHCGHAPCEPVCPVYATYHSEEGLNTMVYNRCVGTRYCSNNCSYKVRRFNWFEYEFPEPLNWQLNPDMTVRTVGVMEKCTFCIQRIRKAENSAKNEGRPVKDGEFETACQATCPTKAISFGNLLDKTSVVARNSQSERGYKVLDKELNTQPAITYLARIYNDE